MNALANGRLFHMLATVDGIALVSVDQKKQCEAAT
jgi:hypothetical protein